MNVVKTIVNILIASVWIFSGLFCKLLNFVPRHKMIVARILGEDLAAIATNTIGVLEILMGVWVLSKIKARFCALTQIVLVATMNIMEIILAPDLLLFGKANAIAAIIFISAVFMNGFKLNSSTPLNLTEKRSCQNKKNCGKVDPNTAEENVHACFKFFSFPYFRTVNKELEQATQPPEYKQSNSDRPGKGGLFR
jgi:hypothetical protein